MATLTHPWKMGKNSHRVVVGTLSFEPFYKNRGTNTKVAVVSR